MTKALKIAHLYPDYLNLYGDGGNILALRQRCQWRNIEIELESISIGEHDKKLSDYDLFFIGGGQDSQQEKVATDIYQRRNEIKHIVEENKPILAICGGYQLMGVSYQTSDAKSLPGIGILGVETKAKPQDPNTRQDRLIGNVSAELLIDLHIDSKIKTLVGFENHSGRTYITDEKTQPLAKIVNGFGNNGEDGYEGAVYKNLFGSYLHGSLLPKNPHFADELIYLALEAKNSPLLENFVNRIELDDNLELAAHKFAQSLS